MSWFTDAVDATVNAIGTVVSTTAKIQEDYLSPIGLLVHPSEALGHVADAWSTAIDTIEDMADFVKENWKAILKYASMALSAVAGIASFIPGIGTAIGAVLNVAAAIAAGKDLTDILISAAAGAVPGGALIQMAVQAGAAAVKGIIHGEGIDAIGMDAVRGGLSAVPGVGPEAMAAFDMATAIAQGKDLQDAGFGLVKDLVGGGDLGQQAVEFANRAVHAARNGTPVEEYLQNEVVTDIKNNLPALSDAVGDVVGNVTQNLPSVVTDLTHTLMDHIGNNPDILHWNSDQWADLLGVPEPVARTARALIDIEKAADSDLPALSLNQTRYNQMMKKLEPGYVQASSSNISRAVKAGAQTITSALTQMHAAVITRQTSASNAQRQIKAGAQGIVKAVTNYEAMNPTAATRQPPPPLPITPMLVPDPWWKKITPRQALVGSVLGVIVIGGVAFSGADSTKGMRT